MIRWITPSLGTGPATLTPQSTDYEIIDVRHLVDKDGNDPQATRQGIDAGVALLRQGKRVVVCCDYGISRSNALAAGMLSVFSGVELEDAIRSVIKATGEHEVKLEVLRAVRLALVAVITEPAREPRVLITGGSGFLAGAVTPKLAARHFCLAPLSSEVDLLAGSVALDLRVKAERINCIVHLANPRIYTSSRALGEMLTMLRNVLEVCRENAIHLIFPSSWEVYSGHCGSVVADESLAIGPKGPYGESKMLCENLIEHHRQLHGLKCTVLRSSPVYGEGGDRPKFVYTFVRKALENLPIRTHEYLNGLPALDLLNDEDFAAAICAAAEHTHDGAINIGTGVATSTCDVAQRIVRMIGSRSEIEIQPVNDYVANVSMNFNLATQILSWKPVVPLSMGLEKTVHAFLSNGDTDHTRPGSKNG